MTIKDKFSSVLTITRANPLFVFLILISCLGAIQSARFGAASLDYYLVKNTVDDWQVNLQSSDPEQFKRANKAIADAQSSHPTHPLYRDIQGQVLEWGALAGFLEPESSLQAAKNYYLEAIKLRPTWPVSYASMAFIKWRLNEFDEELISYLEKAAMFGPYKAEVHILFVELGMGLYDINHPFYRHLQPHMKIRMSLGLRNPQSRARVVERIKSLEQFDTACRWMKTYDNYASKQLLGCKQG